MLQHSLFAPPPTVVVPSGGDPDGLRPYQREAVYRIHQELKAHRSTLIVLATGLGKTQIFSAVARHWPTRVLVLAHLNTLISQARRRLEQMTGMLVDVEQGEARAGGSRIVVGSVQSFHERRRAKWPADTFGLVIIDEAHHVSKGSTYHKIIDHFAHAKVLGVTATPDRADCKALSVAFESVAFRKDIDEGIREGYLCPVKIARIHVDAIDVSGVKTTAGDLNQGELDAIMGAEGPLHAIARGTLEQSGDRRTIVFSGPTVATAQKLVEVMNRYRPGCAHEVNGGTDPIARRRCYQSFEAGEFQYLVNVGVLTEGFDSPRVSCISLARLTKSRALYAQMAGRGLRIAEGKADCLLIDFVGNSGHHELMSALDILGGTHDDAVKKRAKKLLEKHVMSAEEAMSEAAKAIAEDERKLREKRAAVQAKVSYRVEMADPFRSLGMDVPSDLTISHRPATETQHEVLALNGFQAPIEGWSFDVAQRLVGEISRRKQQGLASPKQINTLRKRGIDARQFSKSLAGALVGALVANKESGFGWMFRPGEAERIHARFAAPREPGSDG
jgi:superfamily II DNA or RNA helicase